MMMKLSANFLQIFMHQEKEDKNSLVSAPDAISGV